MDLSNCNIEINWKMGSKAGKTSRFVMAKDIQPGYVIFGWPVDKEITEKSGTVIFAIEFNKKDRDGKIVYCFNTMPISINIKEGLVLEDSIEAVSLDSAVLNILTNSSFGEGDAAVGDIIWLTGNGNGLVTGGGPLGNSFSPNDFQDTINLHTDIDASGVPSSRNIDLFAQAYVDEGTDIRYTDADNHTIIAEMLQVARKVNEPIEDRENLEEGRLYQVGTGPSARVATEEDFEDEDTIIFTVNDLDPSLIYFVKVDDNAYTLASNEQIAAWVTAEPVDLYTKVAKITAEEAGSYVIKAQGQKFAEVEDPDTHEVLLQKVGSGDIRSTSVVTIPEVQAPSKINIEVSELEDVSEGYSFDNIPNVVFLNSEGKATITAFPEVESFGAFQYNWLKKEANDNTFSPVSEEFVPFVEEDSNTFEINTAGEYKVNVVNFLNGNSSAAVESAVVTASALAGRIIGAVAKYKIGNRVFTNVPSDGVQFNSAGSLSSNTVTLKIDNVSIDGQEGTLEYQWFKQVMNDDLETSWEPIDEATEAEYIVRSGDGKFLPVVKNNYNGCVYTHELNSISVNDIAG